MAEDTNQGTNLERNSAGGLNDPHSRRLFLRAAVIGTAGVAGAAGVAGVALARGGKSPSILGTVLGAHHYPSKPPSASLGLELTQAPADSCTLNYGGPGNSGTSFYLIFLASELPAGTYSFDCTEQGGSLSTQEISSSSNPWFFQAANPVHLVKVTAGTGTACPATPPVGGSPYSGLPVTNFMLSSKSDVEIFMHIDYNGIPPKGEQTVFTGTLTGTVSLTATETVTSL